MCVITHTQERIEKAIAKRRERALVRSGYWALLRRLLTLAVVFILIWNFGFCLTQMHGQGMYPALKEGDLCIVYRSTIRSILGEKLVSGDVIVYRVGGERYIGRVAAIPGDVISFGGDGNVNVNGVPQKSEIMFPTYVRGELEYPLTVPEGFVFVLGDHRTDTVDSRDLGTVPLESVEGKVISILRRRGL